MSHYIVVFVAGIAGSLHCIGMCGGFACALGVDPAGKIATLYKHLLYNIGRVTTYMFMGGLAGIAGEALCLPEGISKTEWISKVGIEGFLDNAFENIRIIVFEVLDRKSLGDE